MALCDPILNYLKHALKLKLLEMHGIHQFSHLIEDGTEGHTAPLPESPLIDSSMLHRYDQYMH